MPKLFKSPTPAMVEQRRKLSTVWNDDAQARQVRTPFNVDNEDARTLAKDCTDTMLDKLAVVQAIDKKIVGAFALGLAAFVASWILPVTFIAIGAFAYAGYEMAKRQTAYAEYTYAFENLETAAAWCFIDADVEAETALLRNPVVRGMVNALTPVMSKEQMKHIKIEDETIAQGELDVNAELETNPLIKDFSAAEQKELMFKLYGKDQGSYLYIFQAAALIIQNAWKSVSNSFQQQHDEDHDQRVIPSHQ